MHNFRHLSVVFTLLLVLALSGLKANAQLELVENGSFETGDFTGWTVVQEFDSGGDWFVYSGNMTPLGSVVLPPPDGIFAAVTDQGDPSSQVLFQDLDIRSGSTVTCSVIVYYENTADEFVNGPDLSLLTFPNQQARIDIMDPLAPDFDIGAGVLLNLFQTNPGDPLSLGYTTINFDLSGFAGTIVRFRVAEVDNLGPFQFSIDDVTCTVPAQVPTLGEWGMIAMAGVLGLAGLAFALRRRRAAV